MPATTSKPELLAKALKLLDKKFPAPAEPVTRPVLEELIYGVCREGCPTAQADATFLHFKKTFFDWNEIRVSTVPEIHEALQGVPNNGPKAQRIVEILQYVFEMYYSFELGDLDKKGLRQAAKQLARFTGVNDFTVAWVTQRSLGGHAIPLDEPTLRVLRRLKVVEGEIDDLESVRGTIEHYIPKTSGIEFTEHIATLAADLCLEKQPKCAECPLKSDCPTGQENLAKKADPKPKPNPKSR